ncbi:MAG: condensation domain-containing protein [Micromonosporaceae bacterium]
MATSGWRLTGKLDLAALRSALADVVARHEPLRTLLMNCADGWRQEVRPPRTPALVVRQLPEVEGKSREILAEEFLNHVEAGRFDPSELPALWAFLGRFDEHDSVLVLVVFLPLIDGWSLGVVARDFAECYAARVNGETPSLAEPRQYREYVEWQRESADSALSNTASEYWLRKLRGANPIAVTPDRGASQDEFGGTISYRYSVGRQLGSDSTALAARMRSSLFMLLLAVYLTHLRKLTGNANGVVWALTAGPARRHRWLQETVGYFVNMVPIRNDLSGCATFREALEQVKATCLEAYAHEAPFARLAQVAREPISALERGGMVVPGFQVYQDPYAPREQEFGGMTIAPIRRPLEWQLSASDIPDDALLWTMELEASGELIGEVRCSAGRFKQETISGMVADFRSLLQRAVADPDFSLNGI